jgi:probable HAF family extracellular repeat protein
VSPPGAEPDHRVAPASINAGGTVVGTSEAPELGSSSTTAFAWHPVDGSRVLEPLPGSERADVADVNEDGTVVGASSGDGIRAVRWEPGATEPIQLATPAGWSYARAVAVNDSGVIVGTAEDTGQFSGAAVVWEPPGYAPRVLPERGPTYASDVDDDGTVVGYSAFRGESPVGLRWSPAGDMTELGDFTPVAIDDGDIVGTQGTTGSEWLWPAGADAPHHLGTTPGRHTQVTDITGDHIVGYLEGPDDTHAARFTPTP